MNYVAHDCRGTRDGSCNNRWIDKDVTGVQTQVPTWKYCRECCEKMGIDFDKQKPSDYYSDDKKEQIEKMQDKKNNKH